MLWTTRSAGDKASSRRIVHAPTPTATTCSPIIRRDPYKATTPLGNANIARLTSFTACWAMLTAITVTVASAHPTITNTAGRVTPWRITHTAILHTVSVVEPGPESAQVFVITADGYLSRGVHGRDLMSSLHDLPPVGVGDAGRRRRGRGVHSKTWRRPGPLAIALAVVMGLLGSGTMMWHSSSAVFSSTTSNGSNSWTLGSVTLADDDTGSAMFTATGLVPGATGSNCIAVTYSGNVATTVKLYVSASADASSVAQYINVTVVEGTGGGFGSCGAFVAGTTIINNVALSTISSTDIAYGSGVGTWAPSSSGTKVYKFTYTLSAAVPSAKQSAATTATFQWEAQA